MSDTEAAKAAGVCRQTLSEWRNHDAEFIRALNIAQNELVRATMLRYKNKMAAITEAAFSGVSAAIRRGDAATARWWMDNIGINEIAKQIFQNTVDPAILPEGLGAVVDEMARQHVDAFLATKGIGALERLRLREAMTVKEAEALREEYGENASEESSNVD